MLYSVCNLKTAQINVQRSQIWELTLYEFEAGHNATKATKNIYCGKGDGVVDISKVTWLLKKVFSDCKCLNYQARSDKPKTVDSNTVLHAIEVNPASSTCRVSSELDILEKVVKSAKVLHVTKILQTFGFTLAWKTLSLLFL